MLAGVKRYLMRQLITLDQAVNTLFDGEPDETISSRAGREEGKKKWATLLCKALNWIEKDHCKKSIEFLPDGTPDPHHLIFGKEKE